MQSAPFVWCELVHPLFTFMRIHIDLHRITPPDGGAAAAAAQAVSQGVPGMFVSRPLDWHGAIRFCAIADLWLALLTPWRARPRIRDLVYFPSPTARQFSFADAVRDIVRETRGEGPAAVAALLDRSEISARVRALPHYQTCIAAQHDFAARRIAATLSPSYQLPEGVSQTSADCWLSWIGLHYSFYV
jgi:hypothetical protein